MLDHANWDVSLLKITAGVVKMTFFSPITVTVTAKKKILKSLSVFFSFIERVLESQHLIFYLCSMFHNKHQFAGALSEAQVLG